MCDVLFTNGEHGEPIRDTQARKLLAAMGSSVVVTPWDEIVASIVEAAEPRTICLADLLPAELVERVREAIANVERAEGVLGALFDSVTLPADAKAPTAEQIDTLTAEVTEALAELVAEAAPPPVAPTEPPPPDADVPADAKAPTAEAPRVDVDVDADEAASTDATNDDASAVVDGSHSAPVSASKPKKKHGR
jgi:hypothetical protein